MLYSYYIDIHFIVLLYWSPIIYCCKLKHNCFWLFMQFTCVSIADHSLTAMNSQRYIWKWRRTKFASHKTNYNTNTQTVNQLQSLPYTALSIAWNTHFQENTKFKENLVSCTQYPKENQDESTQQRTQKKVALSQNHPAGCHLFLQPINPYIKSQIKTKC